MVRTQVQFTEEQLRTLREMAAAEGVSVSSLVRRAVDEMVENGRKPSREELYARASQLCGAFNSGTGDIAARHDEIFAEAAMDMGGDEE